MSSSSNNSGGGPMKLINCDCVDENNDTYTLLGIAIYNGDAEVVRLLIEGGVDTDKLVCFPYGYTPLYRAKIQGGSKIIKLLQAKGAK